MNELELERYCKRHRCCYWLLLIKSYRVSIARPRFANRNIDYHKRGKPKLSESHTFVSRIFLEGAVAVAVVK